MVRRGKPAALVLLIAVAGCRKSAPPPPAPESPEMVFEKFRAAYVAGDGKTIWSMYSRQARLKQEQAFADLKALTDAEVHSVFNSNHIELAPAAMRAMSPEEFTTVTAKAKMKDDLVYSRYRRLEAPKIWKETDRLRVVAQSPDGKFSWTVWLVEESNSWKVEEEKEEEDETVKIGDPPK